MFRINRGQIEAESKTSTAKSDDLRSNIKVFDAVKLVFLNLVDEITRLPVYNSLLKFSVGNFAISYSR